MLPTLFVSPPFFLFLINNQLRRFYRRKVNDFWSLSEEEKKQLKEQGRL
jgi:hypothetical protein